MITENEGFLILMLEALARDRNLQAIVLQNYIQACGPVSEATGEKIRKILSQPMEIKDADQKGDV